MAAILKEMAAILKKMAAILKKMAAIFEKNLPEYWMTVKYLVSPVEYCWNLK